MKKGLFIPSILFYCIALQAQTAIKNTSGDYYLRGVMETTSGFQLKNNQTFQFFFSYGSLDRFGTGSWAVQDDIIILNSGKAPAYDFKLLRSNRVEGDSVTIKVSDNNAALLSHVFCTLRSAEPAYQHVSNKQGEIKFTAQNVDSITLIFEFCPERSSSFCIELENRKNNYFEFKFEPWVTEVFFENFKLKLSGDRLVGKHPLLEGDNFSYVKVKK